MKLSRNKFPVKNLKSIFLLCLIFGGNIAVGQLPKSASYDDLPKILKLSKTDSIYKLERQAAMQFHKLINQYRKSKSLPQLSWDDGVWLAARNHSLYMAAERELAHGEKSNSRYFTGKNERDRMNKIFHQAVRNKGSANNSKTVRYTPNKKYMAWGENVYRFYSSNLAAMGRDIPALAKVIAQSAFDGWKNSPGHNANMLSKRFNFHGTAFIVHKNRAYSTDDFIGNWSENKNWK